MKKNIKGFTLVELLATIAILGIIFAIAVPSYLAISSKIKQNSYQNKVAYVLAKSEGWSFDTDNTVTNIQHLLDEGYLEADNDHGEFKSPVDETDMRCMVVRIQKEGNQYHAELTGEENCDFAKLHEENSVIELVQLYQTEDGEKINPSDQWIGQEVELKVQFKTKDYEGNPVSFEQQYANDVTELKWDCNDNITTTKIDATNPFFNNTRYHLNVALLMNATCKVTIRIEKDDTVRINEAYTKVKIDMQKPDLYLEDSDMTQWDDDSSQFNIIGTDFSGSGVKGYFLSSNLNNFSCPTNPNSYVTRSDLSSSFQNNSSYYACIMDNVGNIGDARLIYPIAFIDYKNSTQFTRSKFAFQDNQSISVTAPTIHPYPGHSIVGWSSSPQSYVREIEENATFTVNSSNTYYAVYTWPLTIHYNGNGGSNIDDSVYTTQFNSSGSVRPIEATLSSSKPTRNGYSFAGWSTSVSGSVLYQARGKISNLSSNLTLYAKWNANSYRVNFNANGGSVSPTSKTVTYESSYGTLPTPARTGYRFVGWYTSVTGGSQITSSTKVTITSNQTLYAHWVAQSFTVNFNANGGSVSPTSKTVTYGNSYNTLPTPTKAGYRFLGWYTSVTGGSQITSSTKVTITSNQTLYAHWQEDYKILYSPGRGINELGTSNSNWYTTKTPTGKNTGTLSILSDSIFFKGNRKKGNGGGIQGWSKTFSTQGFQYIYVVASGRRYSTSMDLKNAQNSQTTVLTNTLMSESCNAGVDKVLYKGNIKSGNSIASLYISTYSDYASDSNCNGGSGSISIYKVILSNQANLTLNDLNNY